MTKSKPMQKILHFELGMAVKDRPKFFQVLTLVLFAFSLTIVLLSALSRLTHMGNSRTSLPRNAVNSYAEVTSSMPATVAVKK